MAQSAKFIDVTRTFLPIDPNTFPESMHVTAKEDAPEERIPVAAYIGQNFLPTSYGYKSYFGINGQLAINKLNAKVDKLFVYQSDLLKNILVALCDSGIWVKEGSAAGDWYPLVPMIPPPAAEGHNEWTYAVLANNVHAYQAGQPHYIKLSTAAPSSLVGIVATKVVPTFLNMEGQIGIFRAGGRLGFWDSMGSVAWSDLDTFADFEPSIETLAGNALFKDVTGRIVAIKASGKAFIIYSTKSVILVAPSSDATIQWAATSLLSACGIAYPRQAIAASPDVVHFAYTTNGLYKIDAGKPELIIPEVTDFMKEVDTPIYLALAEGRYLFFEILDQDYILSTSEFKEGETLPIKYTFPGDSYVISGKNPYELPDDSINPEGVDPDGNPFIPLVPEEPTKNFCKAAAGRNDGKNTDGTMGPTRIPNEDKKPGTREKPKWTAYFSRNGVQDASNIEWGQIPCGTSGPKGEDWSMCPKGLQKLSDLGDDSKKKKVTGAEAYQDGNMTMERFTATQTAIWEMEDAAMEAVLNKIGNRAFQGTSEGPSPTRPPVDPPPVRTECLQGRYPGKFSSPTFDYNSCSFWLTRYATEANDLYTITYTTTKYTEESEGTEEATYLAEANAAGADFVVRARGYYDSCMISTEGVSEHCGGEAPYYTIENTNGRIRCIGYSTVSQAQGGGEVSWVQYDRTLSLQYKVKVTKSAYNELRPVVILPTPDTAFCLRSGTTYITPQGESGSSSSTPECADTNGALGGTDRNAAEAGAGGAKVPKSSDGTLCNTPFEPFPFPSDDSFEPFPPSPPIDPITGDPIIIPGTDDITITWSPPDLIIPGTAFLLQKGSYAALYPTIYGALVYDLHLKKWGKIVLQYKQLLDYSPINDNAGSIIPYDTFGIMAGVIREDGYVYIFDSKPKNSYITYGKIGYYRLGMTSAEEVHVHFRSPSTGRLAVGTSLDRQYAATLLTKVVSYSGARKASLYGAWPGAWQNITISGIFDISYLEYRGFVQGRR